MKFLWVLIFSILGLSSFAQIPGPPPDTTTGNLEILNAARYNFNKIDSITSLLSLAIDVRLKQGTTLFYADSMVLNERTKIVEAFGNVHINDNDSVHTYANYLHYDGVTRKAIFKRNVRMLDNNGVLTADNLDYDLTTRKAIVKNNVKMVDVKGSVLTTNNLDYDANTKVGNYINGGKVVNKKTTLTSKKGTYYGSNNDVVFSKDVVMIDPEYRLVTDSLVYNTQTEIARFVAPTTILNKGRKIYTSEGYYDLKLGKAFFSSRTTVIDGTNKITADKSAFDDKTGIGQWSGHVVFIDSANGISLLSEDLSVNNKTKSFLATNKPLMILVQDNDSTYISADTLLSGQISTKPGNKISFVGDTLKSRRVFDFEGKDSTANRYFEAYSHVRIFNDSLQAVADSMFYAGTDSVFRLFKNPIVWGSKSQITADTIYLFTKDKKAERLLAFENGFVINHIENEYFNQVKGNTIKAYFKDGGIEMVHAKSRAESVYYAQDEQNKYVGMNKSSSDAIDMYFKDKQARKIVFVNDLKGVTYPMRQIPTDENKLQGFIWHENKRPKTKFELM